MEYYFSRPPVTHQIEISTDQTMTWIVCDEYDTLVEANDRMLRLTRAFPTARFKVVEVKHAYKEVS